jgi:HEAT repeat protein
MSRSVDDELSDLRRCTDRPDDPANAELVLRALRHRSYRVVQRAAILSVDVAAKSQCGELAAALLSAYKRFLEKPEKVDPGCPAKTAIIDALRRIDFDDIVFEAEVFGAEVCGAEGFDEEGFFTQATRYRQLEPVFGGSVDAAAELRVHAAFALVEMGSRRALPALVDLLADSEAACRAGAARALATTNQDTAKFLLRLKVRQGDKNAQVLGECVLSFLEIGGADAVPLAVPYLNDANLDRRLETAIALGTSRHAEAFAPLKQRAQVASDAEERRIMFTALALLQYKEAIDFLLEQVNSADVSVVVAALHALSHLRDQDSVRERLKTLALEKSHPDIRAALEKYFGE